MEVISTEGRTDANKCIKGKTEAKFTVLQLLLVVLAKAS